MYRVLRYLSGILLCLVVVTATLPARAQRPIYPVITTDNVNRLTQIQELGEGHLSDPNLGAQWAADSKTLIADTTMGTWEYSIDSTAPRLLLPRYRGQDQTFSDNRNYLAVQLLGGVTIQIIDPHTGVKLAELLSARPFRTFEFRLHGTRLITQTIDGTYQIWNTLNGHALITLQGIGSRYDQYYSLFSDNDKVEAIFNIVNPPAPGTYMVYNVETGDLMGTYQNNSTTGAIAVNNDGTQFAMTTTNTEVTIFNTSTQQPLFRLNAGPHGDVEFSLTGSRLISFSHDKYTLWDTTTGKPLSTVEDPQNLYFQAAWQYMPRLDKHPNYEYNWRFSPPGDRMAIVTKDRGLLLWDLQKGGIQTLNVPNVAVSQNDGLAFSSDGSRLAVVTQNNTIQVWDVAQLTLMRELPVSAGVFVPYFSPNNQFIVIGSRLNNISSEAIWNVATGVKLSTNPATFFYHFSPDSHWVLGAAPAGEAVLWDLLTDQPHPITQNMTGLPTTVGFSQDGQLMAVGMKQGQISIWDAQTDTMRLLLNDAHTDGIQDLFFTPDNKILFSIAFQRDRGFRLWDVASGKLQVDFTQQDVIPSRELFGFGPQQLLLANGDSPAIFDIPSGTLKPITTGGDFKGKVVYSSIHHFIVTADKMGVHFWDTATQQPIAVQSTALVMDGRNLITDMALTPDQSRLFYVTHVGNLVMVDATQSPLLNDGLVVNDLPVGIDDYITLHFANAGRELVYGSYSGFKLLNLQTYQDIPVQPAAKVGTYAVVSPDGKLVAAGTDSGRIYLWDATTGMQVKYLDGHLGAVLKVAFNPDGTSLVSTSDDGTVRVWRIK